jgi:hypothetical protein
MSVTEEFSKVIKDFIADIKTTFVEYTPLINKWWVEESFFNYIEDDEERKLVKQQSDAKSILFVFEFCKKKIPPRFFDILNQNEDIFKDTENNVDTEFLPYIHFKDLWKFDLSQKTRDTIWKYLQLILFSIVGTLEHKEEFGDTAKLFESIDEDDFKNKLQETLKNMENMFNMNSEDESSDNTNINMDDLPIPNASEIHEHITGMLNGKLGKIAKEIAEETANDLNIDMENCNNVKDVFSNLIQNPTKIMGLVKSVGDKLDSSIKSGEIKESELMTEATEIMNKMKNMPGLGDISSILNKMGLNKMGGKFNMGAMESQLKKNTNMAKMKERCRAKAEMNRKMKEQHQNQQQQQFEQSNSSNAEQLSEEQLTSIFSTGEKVEKTPRKPTNKKRKAKK